MVRTFGPINGAGTRIEEQSGDQQIQPGALGFAGFAGVTQKGPVGEYSILTSKALYTKRYGGIIDAGQMTDNARDYYDVAAGAGGLVALRITDGTERKSEVTLYTRDADSFIALGVIRAKNGGRWGGKQAEYTGLLDNAPPSADLTNTVLTLPTTLATTFEDDELAGGFVELEGVPNARYPILGNDGTAGTVTVNADQTMADDLAAGGDATNARFYLVLENEAVQLAVRIDDGNEDESNEFSLKVFLDGAEVALPFGNLSTDPDSPRYWVNVINQTDVNDEIEAEDLFVGTHTAATRPANAYRRITGVTALTVNVEISTFTIASPGGGDPTFALGTTTDAFLEQVITITMTTPTSGTAVSDRFGALGTVTLGTLFDPANAAGGALVNKWVPPFTVTAGGNALAAADTLTINYRPLPSGQLVAGRLWPDKPNAQRDQYRIVGNDHDTITVAAGVDLTTLTAIGEIVMVAYQQQLSGGRDGNNVSDADFESKAWDVDSSPFNSLVNENLGLVKFATPNVTSLAVQKAGIAYAAAKNHTYRPQVPGNITTEEGVLAYVNDTLGRSMYAKLNWPSEGDVLDPDPEAAREGKRKRVSLTGMILGREARIAVDFQGYHKAGSDISAVLPSLLSIPTGRRALDEERLNPAGINVIKKLEGNFVPWGDRSLSLSSESEFRFAHKREQMSYYEQVLLSNFNFIIFAINDGESDVDVLTSLRSFFQPEFAKRALRGDAFTGGSNPAAIFKVDSDINTDATRANGDKFAQVSLRLADTTERLIIQIGQQGVTELPV